MSDNAKHSLLAMLSITWAGVTALAQPVPPLNFVTVGAAGNRGTLPSERPSASDPDIPFGAVAYEFRITRTEVLADQWWEFIEAYRPYYTGAPTDSRFTSTWIGRGIGSNRYARPVEWANFPVDTTWEFAARYCNWLHNDKRPEQWAFESGAYDTTTFTFNADGTGNHQATRSEGARFWIPSYDELFKAFYYDPDRYGVGQGGYWEYSNMSNTPFVTGLPQDGGTTNAGLGFPHYAAAQYPSVQSAFGLLDTSGGQSEWTETSNYGPFAGPRERRFVRGSAVWNDETLVSQADVSSGDPFRSDTANGSHGFRLASVVPSPGALSVLTLACFTRRRRWI
jgi:hypothetical protein